MSNTVDVEALVASFRGLLAKPITEVAGLMCSRGEIAALLDAIETRDTALSTLAKERDDLALRLDSLTRDMPALHHIVHVNRNNIGHYVGFNVVRRLEALLSGGPVLPEIAREALSTAPAAREVGVTVSDWSEVAKLAGQHGIRYRTNAALEAFLSTPAVRSCLTTEAPAVTPEVREAGTLYYALCYLHDWDPDGNIYPQISSAFLDFHEAERARKQKLKPAKYHVVQFRFTPASQDQSHVR